MFRSKLQQLREWKDKPERKPLILNGARQVGKSWLIRELGRDQFNGQMLEINFERSPEFCRVFAQNLDPRRILRELMLLTGQTLEAGRHLLFFDEIQACPAALMSLRYFYEELPQLHLIAAGSLLDFTFRNIPYPVGRVEFDTLHPLTFAEFLLARDKAMLLDVIRSDEPVSAVVENLIYDELQQYFIVGGMPECVKQYVDKESFTSVIALQQDLLYAFRQDFRKYQPQVNTDCLNDVLQNSIQLIGSQTQYSKLSDRFSNPTIKQGHTVLCLARLLHRINNVSIAGLPLTPSGRQFKTFFLDIGLMMSLSRFDYTNAYVNKTLPGSYEGRLAEQFVAQQLLATNQEVCYWARTEPGTNAEVDFVTTQQGRIVPIEVKAGAKGGLKSLHYLLATHPHIPEAMVFGRFREGIEKQLRFMPIYKAGIDPLTPTP
ncbi:ATP-binding protein [Rudanella lutea]|uniref:ATP-binding protein n=1 Tax=Rudanella lutea TaxID=451374 RepID=UPI00047F5509|nr:AAA family ATPase [Rudanella lutea]